MAIEDRNRNIDGSDVTLDIYQDNDSIPKSPSWSESGPWLPKTDYSRDRIIANED